jgi:uncharacterized protein
MALKQQIQSGASEALKAKDAFSLPVLRMALAAITSKEKEKRYKASKEKPELQEEELLKQSELSDDDIIAVLSSEIKKRRDAIALYEQGNRPELAEQEKKEITVLQNYLPEQLSQDALKKLVQKAIEKTGAKEMKDMGKIMAELMPKVKGKADNSEISKMVKELL